MASSATETETVRASHILIKHEGSRRKASWKDPDGRVISATTRADAAARLADLRDQILSGRANFADLAARHSDCSSARRGGDLGASPDLISLSQIHFLAHPFVSCGLSWCSQIKEIFQPFFCE
jgi:NIMA-interacting peptidyl-prolyl cis-trans isomerase 1